MKKSMFKFHSIVLALAISLMSIAPSKAHAVELEICGVSFGVAWYLAVPCASSIGFAITSCAAVIGCPGCTAGIAAGVCATTITTSVLACGLETTAIVGIIKSCFD